jgi:hypothetical protein
MSGSIANEVKGKEEKTAAGSGFCNDYLRKVDY